MSTNLWNFITSIISPHALGLGIVVNCLIALLIMALIFMIFLAIGEPHSVVPIIVAIIVAVVTNTFLIVDYHAATTRMSEVYSVHRVSATDYKKQGKNFIFKLNDGTIIKVNNKQIKNITVYTTDKSKFNKIKKANITYTNMKHGYRRANDWVPRVQKATVYTYQQHKSNDGFSKIK